jgi:DNA mismatch repair ATPase MutS
VLLSLSVHSRRFKFKKDAGFFKQALEQKKAQPEAVVLICNGEFHETFGVDALMLMAYAGLRAMGGEAKAGCPVQNVQLTCNDLTGAGLTVAVCEQSPTASATKKKGELIPRVLKQIVSPAQRMYLNDMTMRDDDIAFPENQPFVGLQRTATGYTMCQVYMDERYVRGQLSEPSFFPPHVRCVASRLLPVVVPWLVP